MAADRVDAWGSHLRSLATLQPHNPVTGTGVRAELTHSGLTSRRRQRRADVLHQSLDPVLVAGPWLLTAAGAYLGVRRLVRARRG